MNTLTSNQKVLIAALVGFIIGAGAVWVWVISSNTPTPLAQEDQEAVTADVVKTKDEKTPAMKTSAATTAVADASNLITVPVQAAGSVVNFTVSLAKPGWVVVREDRSGEFGNALGARWLPAGKHTDAVELLRDTVATQLYHVVLYTDNGDKQFDIKSEVMLVDQGGKPIETTFTAQ